MKLYRFETTQRLALDPEEAWAFFSDPGNLAAITPPWLNFVIVGGQPKAIYAGLIIRYRIRPFGGVPVDWVTEITHVRQPGFFVDEQRFGPYRFWHHQHHLVPCPGGTEVTDAVHYALPPVPGTSILRPLLVAPRLQEIFAYRRKVLAERFRELD